MAERDDQLGTSSPDGLGTGVNPTASLERGRKSEGQGGRLPPYPPKVLARVEQSEKGGRQRVREIASGQQRSSGDPARFTGTLVSISRGIEKECEKGGAGATVHPKIGQREPRKILG